MGACSSCLKPTHIRSVRPTTLVPSSIENVQLPEFSLAGQTCPGYVVKVYDGDTLIVNVSSKEGMFRHRVRLLGMDAPELHPKNKRHPSDASRNLEILHARACKYTLERLVLHQHVTVKCQKWDAFGRLLATITVPFWYDVNNEMCLGKARHVSKPACSIAGVLDIADWMLQNTPSYPYQGQSRPAQGMSVFTEEYFNSRTYHPWYTQALEVVSSPSYVEDDPPVSCPPPASGLHPIAE